jgi:hypothetical protein
MSLGIGCLCFGVVIRLIDPVADVDVDSEVAEDDGVKLDGGNTEWIAGRAFARVEDVGMVKREVDDW